MVVKNKLLFILSTLVVLVIIMIQFESILALFRPSSSTWIHIRDFLLFDYVINTLSVVGITMLLATIVGTVLAFIVSCYEFPLRKVIERLLYMPLAIPPYIGAFLFVNMLMPQGYLFRFFGLFGIRTSVDRLWTSVLVFTIFLFPYVYISVKGFIGSGMSSYIENSRVLGKREAVIFTSVIVPIAKTSIITGAIFTGLEVLGDFGAVNYLGLHTLSTAIFTSWFSFGDLDSALRLSGMIILPVFFLLIIRGMILRFRYQTATTMKVSQVTRKRLSLRGMILAYSIIGIVLLLSMVLPLTRLITWAVMAIPTMRFSLIQHATLNSIVYSLVATLIILVLAIILATFTRTSNKYLSEIYGRLTMISYALPGPVVAIVVLFFMISMGELLGVSLTTMSIMLLLGYVVRYLGVAYENIENGYKKLGIRYHQVARTLGKGYYKTLLLVDIPMLVPFIISGAILVFIDLIRELPLTLALRPFNFHTLSTQTYQFVNNEMLPESAIPSLIIVAISMVLTSVLFIRKSKK